jgi:pheromone shutdown-related protein TraB
MPKTPSKSDDSKKSSRKSSGFSENVHLVEVEGKQVYLVGTAHLSSQSADEVAEVIENVRPDAVCVELCESRFQAITRPDSWREMDIIQIVRKKQATALLAHMILASFQRRMGDRLGIKPGAEMVRAIEAADKTGAELVLADRSIQVTLLRTWRKLGWWDKMKLATHLIFSMVVTPELDEKEVEALKSQDVLSQVMEAFSSAFPRAKVTLIDERDVYLCEKIRTAPGKSVVAVVGAGHVEGMLGRLASGEGAVDLEPLKVIPPGSRLMYLLQWLIPLLVLGLIGYGFYAMDAEVSWQMVQIWVLANGILAALGAALALAHPLTIVTAFVAAPLTSLNPMVAAGWVAGLCEAWINKPKVRDFESLPSDIGSLKGFWKNSITRILLVVALANLGSSIGTFVGIPLMTSLLR